MRKVVILGFALSAFGCSNGSVSGPAQRGVNAGGDSGPSDVNGGGDSGSSDVYVGDDSGPSDENGGDDGVVEPGNETVPNETELSSLLYTIEGETDDWSTVLDIWGFEEGVDYEVVQSEQGVDYTKFHEGRVLEGDEGNTSSRVHVNTQLAEIGPDAQREWTGGRRRIHTLGNSGTPTWKDGEEWTRWWSRDSKTEVMRLHKDDVNVRNDRALAARIESYENKKFYYHGDGYNCFQATYTAFTKTGSSFQNMGSKSQWGAHISFDSDGNAKIKHRRNVGGISGVQEHVFAEGIFGVPFQFKVCDDGDSYLMYLNGFLVDTGKYPRLYERINSRVGSYVGANTVNHGHMLFVMNPTDRPSSDNSNLEGEQLLVLEAVRFAGGIVNAVANDTDLDIPDHVVRANLAIVDGTPVGDRTSADYSITDRGVAALAAESRSVTSTPANRIAALNSALTTAEIMGLYDSASERLTAPGELIEAIAKFQGNARAVVGDAHLLGLLQEHDLMRADGLKKYTVTRLGESVLHEVRGGQPVSSFVKHLDNKPGLTSEAKAIRFVIENDSSITAQQGATEAENQELITVDPESGLYYANDVGILVGDFGSYDELDTAGLITDSGGWQPTLAGRLYCYVAKAIPDPNAAPLEDLIELGLVEKLDEKYMPTPVGEFVDDEGHEGIGLIDFHRAVPGFIDRYRVELNTTGKIGKFVVSTSGTSDNTMAEAQQQGLLETDDHGSLTPSPTGVAIAEFGSYSLAAAAGLIMDDGGVWVVTEVGLRVAQNGNVASTEAREQIKKNPDTGEFEPI